MPPVTSILAIPLTKFSFKHSFLLGNDMVRLDGLNNGNLFSHCCRGSKPKVKVLVALFSPETSLLSLQMASFFPCPRLVFPPCPSLVFLCVSKFSLPARTPVRLD